MALTADYDAQSAVERELVSDWRASYGGCVAPPTIESGLFKIQAKHLLQFRQRKQVHQKCQEIIDSVYRNALATKEDMHQDDDETDAALLILACHRPWSLQILPTISHPPLA